MRFVIFVAADNVVSFILNISNLGDNYFAATTVMVVHIIPINIDLINTTPASSNSPRWIRIWSFECYFATSLYVLCKYTEYKRKVPNVLNKRQKRLNFKSLKYNCI